MTQESEHREIALRAEALARQAHQGQFRRDGVTPYIMHPRAVAARVADDPLAVAVAWLHDVLEDTATSVDDLRSWNIPEEVIAVVLLLTKGDALDYDEYLAHIKHHPLARRVKIADMLANLSDDPSERQIIKYAKGLLILLG